MTNRPLLTYVRFAAVVSCAAWAWAQPTETATWTGTSDQNNDLWSQEAGAGETSNWSTDFFPDNGRGGNLYGVIIGSPSPTDLSAVNVTIQTLTLQSDGVLNLLSGRSLTIANGAITNDGTININDVGGGITRLQISANTLLDGSGQIVFASNDDNYIESLGGAVLTIGNQQTLTTTSQTLLANSILRAATVNNGVIQADVGGLTLDTEDKTNNNLLQALNGGTLEIRSIQVDNTNGVITAGAGSTVELNQATIVGGNLTGSGNFELSTLDARLDGSVNPVTIGPGANINVRTSERLAVMGTLINNGTVTLNDVGGAVAELTIDGDVALNGSGQVIFQSNDDNFINSVAAADTLTIGADQELITSADAIASTSGSRLSARTVNNGTITADTGGLRLDTHEKTNNNVMQAINGGTLQVAGTTIDNTNGVITAGAGSTVELDQATIVGGNLTGSGNFELSTLDARLDGSVNPVTIGPGANINVRTSERLAVMGTLINNGTVTLNDVGGAVAELTIDGDVALNGSGQVIFQSNDDNFINSVAAADTLTIGADQELTTSAAAIAGNSNSRVLARTVNNGTITADTGGLQLDTHEKTNNNVMQAINGGTLRVAGTTIDNTNGVITAGAGSTVELDQATIVGGELNGSGNFELDTLDARLDGSANPVTIAAGANINVGTSERLAVRGTLTNNGTVTLDDVGAAVAELTIDGDVVLNGSGKVVFQSDDDNVINSLAGTDTLTIGADQELTTSAAAIAGNSNSRVLARTVNNGTITADTGGLQLDTHEKTNNNVMQAINGGTLRVAGTTIDNTNGVITAGAGSTVELDQATIVGGELNGSGNFELDTLDARLDGSANPVTIAAGANINVGTSERLAVRGTLTNNGTVTLDDVGAAAAELTIEGNVALNGSGQVIFQSDDDNFINAVAAADTLTIGADQELITSANAIAGNSNSRIIAQTVNDGTITANTGGLQLDTHPKTNNGTFRALDGGNLVVDDTADLTNYDAATNTLTGGNWEAFDGTLDLDSREIQTIAADTRVALAAAGSITAVTDHLETVAGTLAVHATAQINVTGGLTTPGTLEFGLTDGTVDGFDATGIVVGDVVTFAGGTVDIVDLGLTPGTYTLVTWNGGRADGDTDLTLGLTPANGWIYTLETIPLSELRGVVQLTVVIPEPGALLLLGVLALGLRRR
jgi:hypothetical protein